MHKKKHCRKGLHGGRVPHQEIDPHGHDELQPGGELADDLGDEGGDGVAVVGLVELRLVQPVDQDDEVVLRNLPL